MAPEVPGATPVVCLLVGDGDGSSFDIAAQKVLQQVPDAAVVAQAPNGQALTRSERVETIDDAVRRAGRERAHLLIVDVSTRLVSGELTALLAEVEADPGVASVSALDRRAFDRLEARGAGEGIRPGIAAPIARERLADSPLSPVSVPYVVGLPVVLSRTALTRVPTLPPGSCVTARIESWCAAVSARAFCHLLHPRVFVEGGAERLSEEELEAAFADDFVSDVGCRIRVATRGIRVLIDGRTFGVHETGTEVQTLNLIRALSRRPEIDYVGVSMAGAAPRYVGEGLRDVPVQLFEHSATPDTGLPPADIFHRPYQPIDALDCMQWRAFARRTCSTMQDLITYLNPPYHPHLGVWRSWQRGVRGALAALDGVFTISEYVKRQLLREQLCPDPTALFVAPNGTDHLEGSERLSEPPELVGALAGQAFALVLGSDYGHKNIDLALDAVASARDKGLPLVGVTAGRRVDERDGGMATPKRFDAVHLGRNVSTAERNWLLAHAAVVVYATSAEGFGLVPFEAAAFGTPTVSVIFGAIEEQLGDLPVAPDDWSVASFADAISDLLGDPDLAARQVAAIRGAGQRLTWERTAAAVLAGYREMLARPPRG